MTSFYLVTFCYLVLRGIGFSLELTLARSNYVNISALWLYPSITLILNRNDQFKKQRFKTFHLTPRWVFRGQWSWEETVIKLSNYILWEVTIIQAFSQEINITTAYLQKFVLNHLSPTPSIWGHFLVFPQKKINTKKKKKRKYRDAIILKINVEHNL